MLFWGISCLLFPSGFCHLQVLANGDRVEFLNVTVVPCTYKCFVGFLSRKESLAPEIEESLALLLPQSPPKGRFESETLMREVAVFESLVPSLHADIPTRHRLDKIGI